MNDQRLRELLLDILSLPTAPFHEHHVRDRILELLDPLPDVTVESDEFGNLIACYQRGKKSQSTLAFGAHMDHPAWVHDPAPDGEKGEIENPDGQPANFLGGVPERYRDTQKNPIRWFDDGNFAMWDLPACEIRDDGMVHAPVCDDLIGCVAIVALMEELQRNEVEVACHGIFTRAEEVGFVGAVHLAKNWPLGEAVRFVSLETSSPVGAAEIGEGPAIRVGDRMTVFDDAITGDLMEAAKAKDIKVQRRLLDGGSCEATAMQLLGVQAAGISVLLNGYHNCGENDKTVCESVCLEDVHGLVQLIVSLVERQAIGENENREPTAREAMLTRVEKRICETQRYADATAGRFTQG
jgi:putative aminopeptidase FrvX